MHRGYVKIYRKSIDHALFKKPLTWHFWQYCLLKANHKDNELCFNGNPFLVEKGSFIMSLRTVSKESGLSIQNIRTAIKVLINFKMIEKSTQKLTQQATLLSICNYNHYQVNTKTSNTVTNTPLTQEQHTANTLLTTNKNVKHVKQVNNVKKKKNISGFSEAFTRWWLIYPQRNGRKRGKQKAATLFDKIDSTLWSDLKKATENYTQETAQEFVKDPERFLLNKFWSDFVKSPDKYSKQKTGVTPEKVRSFAEIAAEMPEEIDFFGRKEAKNKTMINVNENKRIEYDEG